MGQLRVHTLTRADAFSGHPGVVCRCCQRARMTRAAMGPGASCAAEAKGRHGIRGPGAPDVQLRYYGSNAAKLQGGVVLSADSHLTLPPPLGEVLLPDVAALLPHAVEALRRHGVSRAVLFGSQVNGCADARSDIDLAIWPGVGATARGYFDLVDELDSLDTLRGWDLVDMTRCSAGSTIAKEVDEHGVELFSQA